MSKRPFSAVERRLGAWFLLALILLLAGYLRFAGSSWGGAQHQHPDENHVSSVLERVRAYQCQDGADIDACAPEQRRWITPRRYFDTPTSTLNPYNRGFTFYVYGNLPVTLVRVAAEATGQTNLREFGRRAAALADSLSILILYLIAARLYGRRLALLASLFSALAVMQIQQSHFFTVDAFVNPFALSALYCAVLISTRRTAAGRDAATIGIPDLVASVAFGAALGLALACKVSVYPLALVLPGALGLRCVSTRRARGISRREWGFLAACLVTGAVTAAFSFRILHPYAFVGLGLNPQWLGNLREQLALASGEGDVPWNLQWARRTNLFALKNLVLWGLGAPLGLAACAGFLLMGLRVSRGEWRHALVWIWVGSYFVWQSLQWNPTMRYLLPIYPLLAMMAAWFVVQSARVGRNFATGLAVVLVLLTGAWAFAFHGIYLRDEPRVAASRWILQNVPGAANLRITTESGETYNQPLALPAGRSADATGPYEFTVIAARDGRLSAVFLPHVAGEVSTPVDVRVSAEPAQAGVLAEASAVIRRGADVKTRGESILVTFATPLPVARGSRYTLSVSSPGKTGLVLTAATFANETDYDYTLPFRVDGYDPFGGIYRGDLNLQVYWDDNPEKVERLITMLGQADFVFVPTNHQYAQITRLPERYPLTTRYYRDLLGCPAGTEVAKCYGAAQPGMFQGRLGFQLAAVFENYPRLGPVVIRDQAAEEAFTFYDHPKVLIFRKSSDFEAARLRATLESVDLSTVVRLTPRQFDRFSNLLLTPEALQRQRAGGTWSALFNYQSIHNRQPAIAAAVWYVFIFVAGLAIYPVTRQALRSLPDHGYPISRAIGVLVLGYLSWLAGSVGLTYSRLTIAVVFGLMVVGGLLLARRQRQELLEEWRARRRYFLSMEGLFLLFFLIGLGVRFGNPDLWHPARGGERPMDFSYLNAVLRSTTFPPFDPWFAGGYINYYYFGFVIVGTPAKLLGIVPAIAYNLILPTLFAMVAMGAFSIGWNLLAFDQSKTRWRVGAGLAGAAFTVLLGNLGSVRLAWRWLRGLAVNAGQWYWDPSRVLPPGSGNEITEFPLFTFLYGDLHAHMMAMPIALLGLSWALAVSRGRAASQGATSTALVLTLGGIIFGALYPANLADIYTYLPIGLAGLAYGMWVYGPGSLRMRVLSIVGACTALVALSIFLYQPYRAAYVQAYGALDPWNGPFTPVGAYLTHWGVPLFAILCWLCLETRHWLTTRPAGSLALGSRLLAGAAAAGLAVLLLVFAWRGPSVGWIALPIAAWAGVLMLRPSDDGTRRFVLFLIATAMLITAVVEVVVVRGDIGRQNTVFKFYLQAWMLLAISAGAAATWTLREAAGWRPLWRNGWKVAMLVLLSASALFTVTGAVDKVRDRWIPEAPRTLDGMTFMRHAQHEDFGRRMDLGGDYGAIRWMQDHVQGSPVLVEAHCSEYRWCTRFTVYTGLPGVVGWNWHQRQQRGFVSTWVTDRVAAIKEFYTTEDPAMARRFIETYDVRYIVVGQLERAQYAAAGIAKFERLDGREWRTVYRDGETVIYESLR